MKTLLITEDDRIRRENTKELLEFSNFKVVTAVNGKQGRKIGYGLIPNIVLCDILMPGGKEI